MKRTVANRKEEEIRDLDYYTKLPYTLVIIPEEAGGFFAKIEELIGCMTQGETKEETLKNIEEAKYLWLKTALERKMEIPIPECMREYSGRFVVRIPASLHRRIATLAEKEGVSLNQMVLSLLTENTAAAEITTAIRAVVWETKKQRDNMYRIENPMMAGEPREPYTVSIPKETWEAVESIKS
jgi:predicted RNase H-like HicB family nuclease